MKSIILVYLSISISFIAYSFSFAETSIVNSSISGDKLEPKVVDGLKQMREEEKMAYDVYMYLYEKWEVPTFYNIAQSEMKHTNAIQTLLKEYGIEDPETGKAGSYKDESIQELYDALIKKGTNSKKDALLVGAMIEDLDIADLDALIVSTEEERILQVYENLNKGSRNHMRTFNELLLAYDVNYEPKHITPESFKQIVESPMERGNKSGKQSFGKANGSKKGSKATTGKKRSSCSKSCGKKNSCKETKNLRKKGKTSI